MVRRAVPGSGRRRARRLRRRSWVDLSWCRAHLADVREVGGLVAAVDAGIAIEGAVGRLAIRAKLVRPSDRLATPQAGFRSRPADRLDLGQGVGNDLRERPVVGVHVVPPVVSLVMMSSWCSIATARAAASTSCLGRRGGKGGVAAATGRRGAAAGGGGQ